MSKVIHLVDLAQVAPLRELRERNMRLFDSAGSSVESLKVSILATCSGSLVNGRVYKGTEMQAGADSWTKPYPRPILIHHASGGGMFGPDPVDPKGRVTEAKFTALRKGRSFENDFKRPDRGGKGSGFIITEAMITDPDAIQKVLDGRYLTVSSSQTTDSMICSICGQDWFHDMCDHQPGHTYEVEVGKGKSKKTQEYFCYGVAGSLSYQELSFVNVPAQVNAQVLGVLEQDETKDSLNLMTMSDHNALQHVALCDAEGNIIQELAATQKESDAMGDISKKTLVEMPGTKDEDLAEDLGDKVGTSNDEQIDDATPDSDDSTEDSTEETPANSDEDKEVEKTEDDVAMSASDFALANIARSIIDNKLMLDKAVPTYDGETEDTEIEEPIHSHLVILQKTEDGAIVGKTYATIGEAEDHDHVIEGEFDKAGIAIGSTRDATAGPNHSHNFEVEIQEMTLDAAQIKALVEALNEANLSDDQKALLESSEFCGPNRAFPVPDYEHVIAARSLIGWYKSDAATKARIMKTVEKKASKMDKCKTGTKKKKKKEEEEEELIQEAVESKPYRDEEWKEMVEELATAKLKIKSLETSLTEKSEEIKALEDDLANETASRVSDLASTLTIVRMVLAKPDCVGVNTEDKFAEKVASYGDRTAASLKDAVSDLFPELDLTVRNLRKNNTDRLITSAPVDKTNERKAPIQRADATNKGPKKAPRNQKRGAEHLAEDLES